MHDIAGKTRNDQLTARVPYYLKKKLQEYATFQEISLSTLVVRMLAEQLGQVQYRAWNEEDNND